MEKLGRNDQTVSTVGTITSPQHALNFVKQYNDAPGSGIVSILRLNAKNEVIGITRSQSDMDSAWRSATVREAVKEKGCAGIIVIYGKTDLGVKALYPDTEKLGDLKRKLGAMSISLIDVIAVCKDRFYSYADERISKTA
ncbi:MAG: hypothetical protein IKR30_04435 [Bacteroidales bacterium]|nr:hypothetical protein [Bacteroidales bacterium]